MTGTSLTADFSDQWMAQIIHHEITLHPGGSAQDWYKLFYQAVFGPGHAIPGADAARNYLVRELIETAEFAPWDLQPLGRYVRVNLRLCMDGTLTAEQLSQMFIRSARPTPLEAKQWIALWSQISSRIVQLHPVAQNLDFSPTNQLARTLRICSHSEEFRRLYHPHYRVVNINKVTHLR